jgi:hypothetical protein
MTRTDAEGQAVRTHEDAGQDPAEEANDTVLGWVAMVLPSWGTSVMFHAAVFLLIAFFTTSGVAQQEPWHPGGFIVQDTPRPARMDKSLVRKGQQQGERGTGYRGHFMPRPSNFSVERHNPMALGPDPLANNSNPVVVIGMGPGGGRQTGGEGLGNGNGRSVGEPIFIIRGEDVPEAAKIVYVVDRSGSMSDSLDYVKMELKRSLRELGPDKQFNVIFFSSGPALEMPARRLVTATEDHKRQAYAFIDDVIAQGETDPAEALQRAFAVKPDVIFFLTDGEFDKTIVDEVKRANAGKRVVVNTIAFIYKYGEALLKQIAADNGGNYKFVAEADLER